MAKKPAWLRKYLKRERQKQKHFAECRAYMERNAILRSLGFANYAAYLRSDVWANIRAKVITPGTMCSLCPSDASQLHHVGYGRAVLLGENLKPLRPLCGPCHNAVEFDGDRKRSVTEAQAVFQKRHFLYTHPDHHSGLTKSQYIRQKITARKKARLTVS